MALPLEKSNELIDKLNALLDSGARTEFGLKQIEREAKKLMPTEPASAHLVLGMISSLNNDKAKVIYHHDLALKLRCDTFLGNQNYSVSLSNIGHFSEALEYARRAYRAEKVAAIIMMLICLNFKCARFEESLKYLDEFEKFKTDSSRTLPSKSELEKFISFMKRYALRDGDLARVTGIAEKLVLKNSLEIKSHKFDIYSENGNEWLNIEIKINASPKTTASLNMSLADELVQSITVDFLFDKVSCRFIPEQKVTVENA